MVFLGREFQVGNVFPSKLVSLSGFKCCSGEAGCPQLLLLLGVRSPSGGASLSGALGPSPHQAGEGSFPSVGLRVPRAPSVCRPLPYLLASRPLLSVATFPSQLLPRPTSSLRRLPSSHLLSGTFSSPSFHPSLNFYFSSFCKILRAFPYL